MTPDRITSLFILILLSLTFKSYAQNNTTIKTTTFEVNIVCEECKEKIVEKFSEENGIKSINVSISDKCVSICYNSNQNSDINLISEFEKIGYTASVKSDNHTIENDCDCNDDCFVSKKKRFLSR